VLSLTDDLHSIVRTAICTYLRHIAHKIGSDLSNQKIFPILLDLMEDEDDVVRTEAINQFCQLIDFFDKNLSSTRGLNAIEKFFNEEDVLIHELLVKHSGELIYHIGIDEIK